MPACEAGAAAHWQRRGDLFVDERLESLGVVHGLTSSRLGNMAESQTRRRLAEGREMPFPKTLRQEHSAELRDPAVCPDLAAGDGWLASAPGECVGVFVADCQPVFMWDADMNLFALVHAGWRGVASGILEKAVGELQRRGADLGRLCVSVGPHISAGRYPVGAELREHFRDGSFLDRDGGLFLDLGKETRSRLAAMGLKGDAVSVSADCTASNPEDFFSWRRDGVRRNMLAFLQVPR